MKLCPVPLWESLAREDVSSTFFQTPAWHRIAAAHYGASSAPLLFEFARAGETVSACLPLLRDRRWGRDRYFSPFGTYTALLCPRTLEPGETAAINAALAGLNLHLASSPFALNEVGAGRPLRSHTHVVDLSPELAESPGMRWERDARRRVRIARDSGMTVRRAAGAKDWDAYYALYLKSLRRWGSRATSAYPEKLLAAIRREETGAAADAIRLWVLEKQGVLVAGCIAFSHQRHACLWHSATDSDYFKLGATQLLYHDILADAAARGFATFDFLPSGGLPAVEAFKASLGTRVLGYDSYLNRTGLVGRLAEWRAMWKGNARA